MRYEQLGDYAATILEPSTEPIRFSRPQITVDTVQIEGFDAPGVTVLYARLTLTDQDNAELELTVGHADLLSLEVGRITDIRRALDLLTTGNHWDDLAPWTFAGLFKDDGDESLFSRYPKGHLKVATIVRDLFVDPAFRGNHLGAWMLAELAGRAHDLPALFIGEPRCEDLEVVDVDAYWKDTLKANQFDWQYQTALAGSPGMRAARESLTPADPICVSSADIRARYDAADKTLWPRALVMRPLRLDLREVEYQQLRSELLNPATEWDRRQEIQDRLDEIREEKDEELKEWELAHEAHEDSPQESGGDEADIDDDAETAATPPSRGGSVEFDLRGPWPDLLNRVTHVRVLSWNIGHRITRKPIPQALGEALTSLDADVLFLNEFVDGGPDRDALRDQLRAAGYTNFAVSDFRPRHNQVFAASRFAIEIGDIAAPTGPDSHAETNFLHIRLYNSDIELIGLRAPAYKTANERRSYWSDLTAILRRHQDRALVVAGDMNLDPFKAASNDTHEVEFPGAEMYRVTRPEGPWSFTSLHDPSRASCIDHVVHSPAVTVTDVEYRYTAGGVDLAGQSSPHKGDHAVLSFSAERR